MNKRFLYIRKGVIVSLFLLILGGIIVNSTFFLHAHKNESGKIIFHAHPFDKGAEKEDPLAKHHHSKIDLDFLSSFEYYTIFEVTISFDISIDFELELLSRPCFIASSNVYFLFTTRGPPAEYALA